MSPSERRTAARAALVLLLASTVRWGWERSRAEPLLLPDTAGVLGRLLEGGEAALAERERRERPLGPDERLDPNRAPEAELDRLPGVGPSTARAIVEARERTGGFHAPEDLLAVSGVGPRTLERMRPHLAIVGGIPRSARRGAGSARGRAPPRPVGGRPVVGSTPPGPGAAPGPTAPLDLNRATAAELEALPGVGPAIAGRIVAHRERLGGFRTAEDLLGVRGIGPATLERIRPLVRPR